MTDTDTDDEEPQVPTGVLEGITDVLEDDTASFEDLKAVLRDGTGDA